MKIKIRKIVKEVIDLDINDKSNHKLIIDLIKKDSVSLKNLNELTKIKDWKVSYYIVSTMFRRLFKFKEKSHKITGNHRNILKKAYKNLSNRTKISFASSGFVSNDVDLFKFLLKEDNDQVRYFALKTFGRKNPVEVEEFLPTLMKDKSRLVRTLAKELFNKCLE